MNEDEARYALDDFGKLRDAKYPMIRRSWENHWNDFTELFDYPDEIRRVLYTTNVLRALTVRWERWRRIGRHLPMMSLSARQCILRLTRPDRNGLKSIRSWGLPVISLLLSYETGLRSHRKLYLHKFLDKPFFVILPPAFKPIVPEKPVSISLR